jgi:ABC-type transport system substrate-binding protein
MSENRPGLLRVWSRNPDYHIKGRPFMDKIEHLVIPEYGSRLSQFKAGLIWTHAASQDDILDTRRDVPRLVLRQADGFATAPPSLAFGYDGDSPWKDERLRQAVSLLLDRETMVDLKTDRARLEAEGLPVTIRFHTAVAAGWEDAWVDPTDLSRFGGDGRFLQYDPEEARRLLSAAGFADGIDTPLHYNGGNEYSPSYTRTAELVSGMLHAGSVRARLDPRDYQGDWLPNYHYGYATTANPARPPRGFPGLIYRASSSSATLATQVFAAYHRNGSRFIGMTPDGKNPQAGDSEINLLVELLRREADGARQKALALDLARLMARKSYDIPTPAHSAQGFTLNWPVVANVGVYRGWPSGAAVTETGLSTWLDTSKAPLAPA